MNYPHLSPPAMQQSDAIVRKLNEIRNAIASSAQQSQNHEMSAQQPNPNLNDYLPKQRLNSSVNYREPNSYSYRRSLEKKLERLFKQEKSGFNENISFNNQRNYQDEREKNMERFGNPEFLTIDRMEMKIQELERKYLNQTGSQGKKERQRKTKAVSMIDKAKKEKSKEMERQRKNDSSRKKKNYKQQLEIQRKLLRELEFLKEEVAELKKNNQDLNGKLEQKNENKKYKKERAKFLLNCILEKLSQIQKQVEKRKASGHYHHESPQQERKQVDLNCQNAKLTEQISELTRRLKKVSVQKEIAEERSQWIEDQLRKLNQM